MASARRLVRFIGFFYAAGRRAALLSRRKVAHRCAFRSTDSGGDQLSSDFLAALGLATALNYAASGLIDWPLAIAFILGGIAGSVGGTRASARLATRKGALNSVFAGLIVIVALYMLARSWPALFN